MLGQWTVIEWSDRPGDFNCTTYTRPAKERSNVEECWRRLYLCFWMEVVSGKGNVINPFDPHEVHAAAARGPPITT